MYIAAYVMFGCILAMRCIVAVLCSLHSVVSVLSAPVGPGCVCPRTQLGNCISAVLRDSLLLILLTVLVVVAV